MSNWSLNDIPWAEFDGGRVNRELVPLIKAACMVEYNGGDYARYLSEVFHDDEEFKKVAVTWAEEEVQHGQALRRWAELADPDFNFAEAFRNFTEGYKLPMNVEKSVRGSRSGELIARCIVEVGTSSYYTAIKEYSDEPVLGAICAKIAADELRHYKLFYTHMKRYLEKENIGFWKRLTIALGRIAESEDDELAYAFYSANGERSAPYQHSRYKNLYMSGAYALYRRHHIESATAMVFKAIGLTPHNRLHNITTAFFWHVITRRRKTLTPYREQVAAMAA